MWVWQKWTNSGCLKQLRLQDATDPTESFIFKLSKSKGLEYFKTIIIVSSEQDQYPSQCKMHLCTRYAPFYSARIEVPKDADTKYSNLQNKTFLT